MTTEAQPPISAPIQEQFETVVAQALNQLPTSHGTLLNVKMKINYAPQQTNNYLPRTYSENTTYDIHESSGISVTNTSMEHNELGVPKRTITQRSTSLPCTPLQVDSEQVQTTVPKQVVCSQVNSTDTESQHPRLNGKRNSPVFQPSSLSSLNLEEEETDPKELISARNTTQDSLMESMLKERARAECGKTTIPINANLRISRVPLQLTKKVERTINHLDRKGQYKQRSDFRKVMKLVQGDVKLRDIFKSAADTAEAKSYYETENETARLKYLERYGNTVGLIGQAGIGKTTLARLMLQYILDKKTLPETQFLFYIPFREVDFTNKTTLLEFILTGCFDWEQRPTTKSEKVLISTLQENPNVVFIFDGLDEASTTCLSEYIPQSDMYSEQTADKFIAKILTGEIFPKAKKLITSRPRQLFELHPDYRPRFVVDIVGLNEEAQLEICKQICKGSCGDVMKYLKQNPDIFACCYVPVNCIITMSILYDRLKEHGTIDIQSLTDIFVHALEVFVRSEHVRTQRGEVWRLSKLAWDGFVANKIVFDERDFLAANISHDVFQAFLCTYVKGGMHSTILQGDKKSSFTHLTWQELFVAIYVMMFHSLEELCNLVNSDKLSKPLWEVVSKFMFGLCNFAVIDRLETVLYPKISENWDARRNALFKSVNCSLKTTLSCSRLLSLCSWVHEAKDAELNEVVANNFPQVIEFEGTILPTNVVNVIYFLKNATKALNIRFRRDTLISPEDFNFLCQQLALLPMKVEKLDITRTKIGDNGAFAISHCLDKIDELHLRSCGITTVGIEAIAKKLTKQSIIKLDLSYNTIHDAGLLFLTDCFRNMEELELRKIKITDAGVKMLASKLALLSRPMKRLDLSYNKICDVGLAYLSKCLDKIQNLELCHNDITDAGVKILTSKVALLSDPMKTLDLGYNNISDEGALFLSECLYNFEELVLSCCHITHFGMGMIEDTLAIIPTPSNRSMNTTRSSCIEQLCTSCMQLTISDCNYAINDFNKGQVVPNCLCCCA